MENLQCTYCLKGEEALNLNIIRRLSCGKNNNFEGTHFTLSNSPSYKITKLNICNKNKNNGMNFTMINIEVQKPFVVTLTNTSTMLFELLLFLMFLLQYYPLKRNKLLPLDQTIALLAMSHSSIARLDTNNDFTTLQ